MCLGLPANLRKRALWGTLAVREINKGLRRRPPSAAEAWENFFEYSMTEKYFIFLSVGVLCSWLHSIIGNFSGTLSFVSLMSREIRWFCLLTGWPDVENDSRRKETSIYKLYIF